MMIVIGSCCANGVVRYFDDERRDGFFCNYCNAHFYEHRMDEMIKTHMKRYCNRKGEAISITRFIFKTAISGHHVILDSDVNEDSHSSDSNDDGDSGESEDSYSIDYNGDIDSEVDKDGHSIDYNGDIDSDGDSDGDSEDSEVMEEDEKSEDDSDGDEKVLEYAREIIDLTMDSSDEDKVVEVVVVDSSDSKTNSSDSTTHSLVSTNHSEELELLADTALRGIFGNQEDSDEDVEQVKKYLNGIKRKYTKKDMKQSDFEKRKKRCDKVNNSFSERFVPGVSRPSLSMITLNEVGVSKIRDVVFDADGSLKSTIVKDIVMKDNHNFIKFGGEVYNDMRWQVPIQKHSRNLCDVKTRETIEKILQEEGIINPEEEMITEMGILIGGTMDQPIHHDISRRFTKFVNSAAKTEIEGWELDRVKYNKAMISSTAPSSILIGMGNQPKVMLGVPKSRVIRKK